MALLDEDPDNPRNEISDADLDSSPRPFRQHGILEPIVVHPADAQRSRAHPFRREATARGRACRTA
jgi:ParB-like chromosome segregation protein Spo0J